MRIAWRTRFCCRTFHRSLAPGLTGDLGVYPRSKRGLVARIINSREAANAVTGMEREVHKAKWKLEVLPPKTPASLRPRLPVGFEVDTNLKAIICREQTRDSCCVNALGGLSLR